MNKQNAKFWIGFYFGLECIYHPAYGKYTLTGFFDGVVVCSRKPTEMPEDDECETFPIEEVSFILKKINPFLFASVSNLHAFIKTKALDGYWMNFDKSINIIYEG